MLNVLLHLSEALKDLICNLQIQSDLSIVHPFYEPLALPTQIVQQLEALPIEIQQSYLGGQLRNFLYSIYFSGGQKNNFHPQPLREQHLSQPIENNTSRGLDVLFYEQLHRNNTGSGYFDNHWRVQQALDADYWIVSKQGLVVQIDRHHHLQNANQFIQPGDEVAVRLPANRLEDGFYVAVGNMGWEALTDFPLLGIYFHVSTEGAIVLMQQLTQHLNTLQIPFTFRVLYTPSNYGRRDAGILHLQQRHYSRIYPILERIYTLTQTYFQSSIPLLTKALAPGVGLAEEPLAARTNRQGFGLNRFQWIANGLLDTWKAGQENPAARLAAIQHQFRQQSLDWQCPYLNPQSKDLYPRLNILGISPLNYAYGGYLPQ